jgi:hypothetical protein
MCRGNEVSEVIWCMFMKIKNDCFEKDLERITKLKMELT